MKIKKRELRRIIREELDAVLLEAAKPNCIPGQPYHDEDGLLVAPDKSKGSWSIAKAGPHSADCRSGQGRRSSANKSVAWTKRPCGRGPGGKGKAKFKCKDGTPSHTPSDELTEFELGEDLLVDDADLAEAPAGDCSACIQQYLLSLNNAMKASKGELGKEQ